MEVYRNQVIAEDMLGDKKCIYWKNGIYEKTAEVLSSDMVADIYENGKEKKPSKITVSDVGLVMSMLALLFVLSGIFLK